MSKLLDWMAEPATILAFLLGLVVMGILAFATPTARSTILRFVKGHFSRSGEVPTGAPNAPASTSAVAYKGPPIYTVKVAADPAHRASPPRLFIQTLTPGRKAGETWEQFQELEIVPKGQPAAGGQGTYSFTVTRGDVVAMLQRQDPSLPFKPFLLVEDAAAPHYRNELCAEGHTVTGAGEERLAAGEKATIMRRVWFLFSGGELHPASTLFELNHVA